YVSLSSPQLVRRAAVTLLCPVVTAVTVGLLFWFMRRLGHEPRSAFMAALLFAAASPAWPYARYYFSEPLAGLLLLAAFYYLWAARAGGRLSAVAAAGALAGFAGLTRPAVWPLVVLGTAAAAASGRASQRWGAAVMYGLFLLPSFVLFAWYNYARFGSPFEQWPGGPNRLSLYSLPIGLYGQLLSPGKSVFLYCPPLAIALWGWPCFWHQDRFAARAAAGVFGYHLLLYSAWTDWSGGWCWGPRFLFAALPLTWLVVPSGLWAMQRKPVPRAIATTAALLGFVVQVLAVGAFYMAHLDRLDAQRGRVSDTYYRLADSPILGAVHTLRHLRWKPLDRASLKRTADRAAVSEDLKAELRNTLDIWPAYLRRFGFGRWVWGIFALGLMACGALWLGGWRMATTSDFQVGQHASHNAP
ncbi:MAG: hypothetical protein N2512_03390, partial [Armatimonadetes bacterium]|nr:hypothetical protein [Armatimonadota bacterium]